MDEEFETGRRWIRERITPLFREMMNSLGTLSDEELEVVKGAAEKLNRQNCGWTTYCIKESFLTAVEKEEDHREMFTELDS